MELHTDHDPAEFLKRTRSYLEAQESLNSLILGIAIRLEEHPEWIEHPPYLGVVTDQGKITLAAVITPPFNLLLAGDPQPSPGAFELLFHNLHEGKWSFPGVNAESRLSLAAAQAWSALAGVHHTLKMRLRAYELRRVILPPNMPSGYLRRAAIGDLDLMTDWRSAFIRESLNERPPENLRAVAARSIENGTTYIWEDGAPVSMAVVSRPTPHGISIGGVYTPPDLRGRGYASACVALLSQKQLDAGKQFCTLFTDLDYPTSNSIYQKIGYRAVGDFSEYGFC